MVNPLPEPFHVMSDLQGDPLLELSYYPENELLYMRWQGHLTAEEVIRGVRMGREQQAQTQMPFRRVLNDNRGASGDWREAMPWLQYEWLPQATAAGLRAVSYVFSSDLAHQLGSREFVVEARPYLNIETFLDVDEAWQWLLTQ